MTRRLGAAVIFSLVGCSHSPRPEARAVVQRVRAAPPAMDASAAPQASTDALATALPQTPTGDVRSFADLFVRDWMDGAHAEMYRHMSRRYRQAYSTADLGRLADQMDQTFGRLRTADFKSTSVGSAWTADGVMRLWTLWYAVATEKHATGILFAKVDVIAEHELAILAFQIVTFFNGVPPSLR